MLASPGGTLIFLAWRADDPWVLERLEAVLQPIMWRNDKISVGDELKLPARSLEVRLPPYHSSQCSTIMFPRTY